MGTTDDLFRVEPVADGVHVAIAAHAYKVNCNTAIVETDDGVLIVDSHSKPSAARAVVARVRELTAKPVRYVVNTHFHWDHWQGNENRNFFESHTAAAIIVLLALMITLNGIAIFLRGRLERRT